MPYDAVARRATRHGRVPRRTGRAARSVVAVTALLAALLGAGAPVAAAAPDAPGSDRATWELPAVGDVLAAFDRNGYNEQDGAPRQIASPTAPGRQALEFRLDGGDQRSEVQPRVPDQVEGDVWFYTYRGGLARDFPTDTEAWQVVLQWHHTGDSGSPPLALEIKQGRLLLATEGENLQDLGPVRGGDRLDVTMRVAFSQDPQRSAVDIWRDGRPVLEGHRPPAGTMLDGANYLKVGLYRATAIDEGGRLWVDDLRVGRTMASVSPTAPTGTGSATAGEDGDASNDPAVEASPSGTAADRDDDAVTWVAGVLLVAVVLLLVATRRDARTRR
ncbi:heparin lyase I family protein [Actinomycetospora chibensis]|uniref:Heparin lyase I family protein n=1 Tax=Actinomycetospora chibensis TaxID=663606 RepID=A0ABV9RMJ6_9PSEU|nr:heparin lyase I family protein [Actinomycetospora chibensis]MDD7925892.1 heparin lyase I family protein [Actinomycetospora chibensis]